MADNRELGPGPFYNTACMTMGTKHNTILDNLIWAIHTVSDTNTEAGLREAYNFLRHRALPSRRYSEKGCDPHNGRPGQPFRKPAYSQPTHSLTAWTATFPLDIPGGPWRYFFLCICSRHCRIWISEIGNVPPLYDELDTASFMRWQISENSRTQNGNASVFVLGRNGTDSPGPYTKEDVLGYHVRTIATSYASFA